ncbi:Uncharacterized protein HZ326_27579 [Fusarium oxysporum f. sp. albedinis]|nr:Uncharacterized protein HZ326_27579 [Fusarium oxysporum f. sp. albedinis]
MRECSWILGQRNLGMLMIWMRVFASLALRAAFPTQRSRWIGSVILIAIPSNAQQRHSLEALLLLTGLAVMSI